MSCYAGELTSSRPGLSGMPMIRSPLVFLALLFASLLPTAAHADAVSDFRQYVDGAASISGQFVQESQAGNKTRKVSGQFAISRPGKFRWAIDKPYEQLIVSDGAKVWLYDKDLNQVTVRSLKDALSATPAALLLGGELLKQFDLKDAGSRDGLNWLVATPKRSDLQFQKITVGMLGGVPARMELTDAFGQVSKLQLTAVSNHAAPAESFQFSPPAGTDVLQQ